MAIYSTSPLHSSTIFSTPTSPLGFLHPSQSTPTFCSCKLISLTSTSNEPANATTTVGAGVVTAKAVLLELPISELAEVERKAFALDFGTTRELWSDAECGIRGPVLVGGRWENVVRGRKKRKTRKRCLPLKLEEERGDWFKRVLSAKSKDLSRAEEAELLLCIKDQVRLEAARRRIASFLKQEPTSRQLAKALTMNRRNVEEILYKGKASRERIIRSYRSLVVSIASRYQGKGLTLGDLIQHGNIGLLRGAERFDSGKGFKLSTYAYWWIKQAILRALTNSSGLIRLPKSLRDMLPEIAEVNNAWIERWGKPPSYGEIAKVLNVEASRVRIAVEMSRPTISLDQPVAGQDGLSLQDIIPGPDELTAEEMIKRQLLKQELQEIFRTILSEREAHVVRLYFGLTGQRPQSFAEIGKLLNLSRERARQLYHIALPKLRQKCILDRLEDYLE